MSGTVIDKATALKHSVAGSNINKVVCKAASHELAGPKKKHVDYLITLTNNPHVSMSLLVDMLGERFRNANWIVVFKSLITTHNLMTLGNEKFLQCLATRTEPFNLETFADRSNVLASEMTAYVHRYSRYLGSVCSGYRTTVIDFYRLPRGDNSPFRNMEATKLVKTSGILQTHLDKLLEFDVTSGELTNGVINTAFLMLYKDLIKLYAAYNDAMINILELFFEMKKMQCKEAIECYRRFITRQENVQKYLKLAEEVGVDQKSHLNLRQVPEDLLPALEQHLEEMDAIRKSALTNQPSPQIKAASEKLHELKTKSPLSNNNVRTSSPSLTTSPVGNMPSGNEDVLGAQRKRFDELKKRASEKTLNVDTKSTDTSIISKSEDEDEDEFTKIAQDRSTPQPTQKQPSIMNELFGLDTQWSSNNPWDVSTTSTSVSTNPFQSPPMSNPWGNPTSYQEISLFPQQNPTTQPNFDSPFGNPLLQPNQPSGVGSNGLGDILQPISSGPLATKQPPPQQKLTTDVDSSLALAANNLSLELGGGVGGSTVMPLTKKITHKWGGDQSTMKGTLTGGPSWQRQQPLQPSTLPPLQQGGTNVGSQPVDWSKGGMYGGYFPYQQPVQPQPSYGIQPSGFGFQPQPQVQFGNFAPQQQQHAFTNDPFAPKNQQPSFF